MTSLPFRILCSVAIDSSLAVLCGLLSARFWLRASLGPCWTLPLRATAVVLVFAQALQLLSLTAGFTGLTGLSALCKAVPAMLDTHAGTVMIYALAAAALLAVCVFLATSPPRRERASAWLAALPLLACLVVRAGVGHAATETTLSLSQGLQCLHLAAMAVWSGAILIAGSAAGPRLASTADARLRFPAYLRTLSRVCTVSVALVFVTGAAKSFTAEQSLPQWTFRSPWSLVLIAKILCVLVALGLGTANRLQIVKGPVWPPAAIAHSVKLLQLEAVAMAAILVLSGTLGNLPL